MNLHVSKSNQPIGRVKCVVDSCHFYAQGDHCLAQEIKIQPPGAMDNQTTDCGTFTPKEMS